MTTSINAYRTANLGTANPRQVLIKTLDAGVRFLAEGEDALSRGEDPAEALGKARTIVGGLMTSLDFEAGDLAQQLLRLYLFALDRIQSTLALREDQGLADARKVLETLESAWVEMPADAARRGMEARPPSGLRLTG